MLLLDGGGLVALPLLRLLVRLLESRVGREDRGRPLGMFLLQLLLPLHPTLLTGVGAL